MADLRLILTKLTELDLVYQTRKPSSALEELARIFHGDMVYVTDEEFDKAADWHRRECIFFPKPKEILDRVKLIRKQKEAHKQYLPEPELTEEQRQENIAKCKAIKKMLAEKNSMRNGGKK